MVKFSLNTGSEYTLVQAAVLCRQYGIGNLELCSEMGGSKFTDIPLNEIKEIVLENKLHIPALNFNSKDDTDEETLRAIFDKCSALMIRKVITGGNDSLNRALKLGGLYGIEVGFENNAGTDLNDPAAIDAFYSGGGRAFMAFNPGNFAAIRNHPYFGVFYAGKCKKHIAFLRIVEKLYTGEEAPLFCGHSEIKELISALIARSFNGYFTLYPGMMCYYPVLKNTMLAL